jgi:hypothetical protein
MSSRVNNAEVDDFAAVNGALLELSDAMRRKVHVLLCSAIVDIIAGGRWRHAEDGVAEDQGRARNRIVRLPPERAWRVAPPLAGFRAQDSLAVRLPRAEARGFAAAACNPIRFGPETPRQGLLTIPPASATPRRSSRAFAPSLPRDGVAMSCAPGKRGAPPL